MRLHAPTSGVCRRAAHARARPDAHRRRDDRPRRARRVALATADAGAAAHPRALPTAGAARAAARAAAAGAVVPCKPRRDVRARRDGGASERAPCTSTCAPSSTSACAPPSASRRPPSRRSCAAAMAARRRSRARRWPPAPRTDSQPLPEPCGCACLVLPLALPERSARAAGICTGLCDLKCFSMKWTFQGKHTGTPRRRHAMDRSISLSLTPTQVCRCRARRTVCLEFDLSLADHKMQAAMHVEG